MNDLTKEARARAYAEAMDRAQQITNEALQNPGMSSAHYGNALASARPNIDPFADTLEGRRQLDALFFYTLFPDKSITFTGDGHFNTREQMIHYVEDYLNEY